MGYTKFYCCCEGTAGATSFTNDTYKSVISSIGGCNIASSIVYAGSGSMNISGDSGQAQSPYSSSYAINTLDFTVDGYIYWADGQAARKTICNIASAAAFSATTFNFRLNSGRQLEGIMCCGAANNNLNGSAAFTTNTWVHVAFVRHLGSVVYLMVSGVYSATLALAVSMNDRNAPFTLGAYGSGGYFSGYFDNMRLYVGRALYTTSFTPSSSYTFARKAMTVTSPDKYMGVTAYKIMGIQT